MKKKYLLMLLMMFSVIGTALIGCGEKESDEAVSDDKADKDDKDDAEEDKDVDEKENKAKSSEGKAVYTGLIQTYEAGEWYNDETFQEAELVILDDEKCEYSVCTSYGDNYSKSTYAGTYKEMDGCFIVSYNDGYDDMIATVYVSGADIVKVADQYSSSTDYSEIIGKYSLDTEIGQIVFEVDENGLVENSFKVGNKKYDTASLFMYDYDGEDGDMFDPEWDLTFSIGETYYDWYIYFAKNSVTYTPYKTAIYGPFAGTYNMDGQLGVVTVTVDSEGNAKSTMNINGETVSLEGLINYNYYDDQISFDLYSDDGYNVFLYLDRFDSGDWYQGYYTITVELAAG